MVVQGDFGSGKSHLLGYLSEIAANEGFVTSRVILSKETPLYDTGKVFQAAVASARLPGTRGIVIEELAHRLAQRRNASEYAELVAWANDTQNRLWPGFAATLRVWESPPDEVGRGVIDFWSGQNLPVRTLRHWLTLMRLQAVYPVRAAKRADLYPQHVRFASRLFQAAGYPGWVILIDEAELIGRYTALQRSRSYAALAQWLGLSNSDQFPGIFTVAAITEDFGLEVLDTKSDGLLAADRLRQREDDTGAARAELGMQAIRRALPLRPPDENVLRNTHDRLREVHGRAYGWSPPALQVRRAATTTRMRAYIRRWITEWDLARFAPGEGHEVETRELSTSYAEDADLLVAPEDDADGGGAAA